MRDLNDLTRPTVPSGAIQERMLAETEERRGVVGPAPALPDDAGAPTTLRTALGEAVAELAPQIVELSHDIHDHPETGYEEHHAVATVAELLRRHGIEPEVGVYGMDTALRAEIPGAAGADATAGGSGESAGTIAILAEYDALPGIGHGCGHNVMCANSVGAFLALASLARTRP
ncbi:MAG: amidohydrolase, partial [Actinomyces sp.]